MNRRTVLSLALSTLALLPGCLGDGDEYDWEVVANEETSRTSHDLELSAGDRVRIRIEDGVGSYEVTFVRTEGPEILRNEELETGNSLEIPVERDSDHPHHLEIRGVRVATIEIAVASGDENSE